MIHDVSDVRSNPQEQIVHAAKVINRSKDRKKVFETIYSGKKRFKTVTEIEKLTGLSKVRVLQEAMKLSRNFIVRQIKVKGETAYEKDGFFFQNKNRILSLAGKNDKIAKVPTKSNSGTTINIINKNVAKRLINTHIITIDSFDDFSKVQKIKLSKFNKKPIKERIFKSGIKKILGEIGEFTDWGGEKNDLFTTRVKINKNRYPAAFAFKGKGTKGPLVPKKMGKKGDQIHKLFNSNAEIFIIQYWDVIDEIILEEMKTFAISKSVLEQKKIYYGIIDGVDTQRIIEAYPQFFKGVYS